MAIDGCGHLELIGLEYFLEAHKLYNLIIGYEAAELIISRIIILIFAINFFCWDFLNRINVFVFNLNTMILGILNNFWFFLVLSYSKLIALSKRPWSHLQV